MTYLIYASKEAAIERADEEGKERGYSYWINGEGTRRPTYPVETDDHMWALDVTDYDLDESEESSTVNHYTPLPDPEYD
jgi:hypothetical protein|tara:strand:+ start:821 stop:1057 length:237 start_codon:yes stop_codon:yes gene_type:complete